RPVPGRLRPGAHQPGECARAGRLHAELPAWPDHGDDAQRADDPRRRLADLARPEGANPGRAAAGAGRPRRRRSGRRRPMSLAERLAAQIRTSGPMTVAQYMTACLHDPQDGYYATRPALGEDGD